MLRRHAMWNNLVLLLSVTVIAQGQYVAEDDGGLMNHIPQYDNAGNLMGDYWWHPAFKLDPNSASMATMGKDRTHGIYGPKV